MNTPSFFAVYTTRTDANTQDGKLGELLVVFFHRDDQTRQDVLDTREHLARLGENVFIRDYESLREIPPLLLSAETMQSKTMLDATDTTICDVTPMPVESRVSVPSTPDPRPEIPDLSSTVPAIHACLKLLAGQCDGARTLDGHGFNKFDAEFGRSLAEARTLTPKQAAAGQKLIRKYQRQLPPDLFAAATSFSAHAPNPAPEAVAVTAPTPAELINAKCQHQSGGQEEGGGNTRLNDSSPIAYVKLFDPSGSWTWYLTEYSERAPDGTLNLAFGLVNGHEPELGYIDLAELAHAKGRLGIGIEIDLHFRPQPLGQIRAHLESRAN